MRSARSQGMPVILAYTILFLFSLQMMSDFVAGIYAYGLLGEGLPVEMVSMLFFLSPFLLLFFRRGLPHWLAVALGELLLLCRALEIWLPTRFQLLVAGLGTGIFLLLFPGLLWGHGRKREGGAGLTLSAALALAVASSMLLRALGSTMDLSNEGGYRAIAWLLAIAAAALIPGLFGRGSHSGPEEPERPQPGRFRVALLGLGIVSVLTLLYFAFMSPMVIARWTRFDGLLIQLLAGLALLAFAWLLFTGRGGIIEIPPRVALLLAALFGLGLTLTLAINQVGLPKDAAAYPLFEQELSPLWALPLIGMLLLFPSLFLAFGLLTGEVIRLRPSLPRVGLGFGLASLFMLVMILGNIFTSVWAYVDPVLEPVSRNRFWHIHFLVALVLALSLLAVKERMLPRGTPREQFPGKAYAYALGIVTIAGVTAAFLRSPRPETPVPSSSLRVAGYNVYQGYDPDGQRSHQAQCALLKEIDADIIGLSESDTARIAGGNFDIVRYLAECLEMYAYGGARTGAGTFGYALLSNYPIDSAETIHLFSGPGHPSSRDPARESGGDQVAVIKARIRAGDRTYHLFVNHFDSQPPRQQPEGFAQLAEGLENVIAIGDYNCEPDEPCFAILNDVLAYCAEDAGDPASAAGKVDHIFVSPDLHCASYGYVDNDASDHPVVTAEIE